jgi:hypothetical protein
VAVVARRRPPIAEEATMQPSKISESLAERLHSSADDDMVELVVELDTPPPTTAPARESSRRERTTAVREAFETGSRPLESEIESAGGEITGRAWINQTVRARLPKRAVAAVTERREVRRLDTTRRIEAD